MGQRNLVARNVQEVESEVQALRAELEAVQARADDYETALEELGRRKDEAAGRLALSRRQHEDFATRLQIREAELEEARQQAVHQDFLDAVQNRNAAGLEVAAAIETVFASLDAYASRHEAVATARALVAPGNDASVPDEPVEFRAAWDKLVELIRSRIDERLADEVVESAARSLAGYEIEKLPEHLQAAARARRRRLSTELAKAKQIPRGAASS